MVETVGLHFAVSSNLSPFIAQVQAANAAVAKFNATAASGKMAMSNAAFDAFNKTLAQTGLFHQQMVNVRSESERFAQNMSSKKLGLGESLRAIKQYRSEMGKMYAEQRGVISQMAKDQLRLQQAAVATPGRNTAGKMSAMVSIPNAADITASGAAAKYANNQFKIMHETIRQGSEAMINLGKNTQWAGRQMMVGMTIPIGIMAGAATAAFIQMDKDLVRIQKVYGSGLNFGDKFKEQSAIIRQESMALAAELARNLGQSSKETLGLTADIAATGKEGQELADSVRQTSRLAVLGEIDRQQAMKTTLVLQSAFKQNTQELTQSIDFMNAVENQTSLTLQDLTEAMPRAGATIKNLGGGVKELSLFMTAMKEGGVSAGEGANALKSGLASIIAPTQDAQKNLMALGIDIKGIANKNAGNLVGTVLELAKAMEKLDPNQKTEAMVRMFGKFQYNKMAAMFNNIGKEGSQTLQVMKLMGMSTQDLAKISAQELQTFTESASGKFKRAMESVKVQMAILGKDFAGIFAGAMLGVTKILDFFNNLPGPVKLIVELGLGIAALIGPIVMIGGVLMNFLGTISKFANLMRAGFRNNFFEALTPELAAANSLAEQLAITFGKVETQIGGMTTATQALAVALQSAKSSASGIPSGALWNPVTMAGRTSGLLLGSTAYNQGQGGGKKKDESYTVPFLSGRSDKNVEQIAKTVAISENPYTRGKMEAFFREVMQGKKTLGVLTDELLRDEKIQATLTNEKKAFAAAIAAGTREQYINNLAMRIMTQETRHRGGAGELQTVQGANLLAAASEKGAVGRRMTGEDIRINNALNGGILLPDGSRVPKTMAIGSRGGDKAYYSQAEHFASHNDQKDYYVSPVAGGASPVSAAAGLAGRIGVDIDKLDTSLEKLLGVTEADTQAVNEKTVAEKKEAAATTQAAQALQSTTNSTTKSTAGILRLNTALGRLVGASSTAAKSVGSFISRNMGKVGGAVMGAGMISSMLGTAEGTGAKATALNALNMASMGAGAGMMIGPWGAAAGAAAGAGIGIMQKFMEAAQKASDEVVKMAEAFNKATQGFSGDAISALGGKALSADQKFGRGSLPGSQTEAYRTKVQQWVDQYGKDQVEALKVLSDSGAADAATTMYMQLVNNGVPKQKAKEFIAEIGREAGHANIKMKLSVIPEFDVKGGFKQALANGTYNFNQMAKEATKALGKDIPKVYGEAGKQLNARITESLTQGMKDGSVNDTNIQGIVNDTMKKTVSGLDLYTGGDLSFKNVALKSIFSSIPGVGGFGNAAAEWLGLYNVTGTEDIQILRERMGLPSDSTLEEIKNSYLAASNSVRGEIEASVSDKMKGSLQGLTAATDEAMKGVLAKMPTEIQSVAETLRTFGNGMTTFSSGQLAIASAYNDKFKQLLSDIQNNKDASKTAWTMISDAVKSGLDPQLAQGLATAINNVRGQLVGLEQEKHINIDAGSSKLAALQLKGAYIEWEKLQGANDTKQFNVLVNEQVTSFGASTLMSAAKSLIPNNSSQLQANNAANEKAAQKAAADQQKAAQKALDADQKALEAAQKQREKDIENVKKYYDDQIEALNKTEEARQKAFEKEQKRQERNKTLRELQLGYMKAIASGDTFAAIGAQMAITGQQKAWTTEDQNVNAQDAAKAKIDALTAERDQKTKTMQEQLDAQKEIDSAMMEQRRAALAEQTDANQAALDAQQEQNAAAATAAEASYEATSAKVAAILNDSSLTPMEQFKRLQMLVPVTLAEWEKAIGKASGLGPSVVAGLFDAFGSAPWSQLANALGEAMISGDSASLQEIVARTKANAAAATAAGVGAGVGAGLPKASVGSPSSYPYNPTPFGPGFDTSNWGKSPAPLKATGGHIRGRGTGTSDSIPAWLSNGEYVVQAKSVSKYGKAFFDHVNAGRFADGGVAGSVGAAFGSTGGAGKRGGGLRSAMGGGIFSKLIDQVVGELTAKIEQAITDTLLRIGELRVQIDNQAMASDQALSSQKQQSIALEQQLMTNLFTLFNMYESQKRVITNMTNALAIASLTNLQSYMFTVTNTMINQWRQWRASTVSDIQEVGRVLVDTFTNINYSELVKMVEAYASGKTEDGNAAKAKVLKKAGGGYISGPGTGTSDSIPALLSNGEYVIKQKSVSKYGTHFLNQVNQGNYPRFADGGLVGAIGENIATIANKKAEEAIQKAIDAKAATLSATSIDPALLGSIPTGGPWGLPVEAPWITYGGHNGSSRDYQVPMGTPVFPIGAGVVAKTYNGTPDNGRASGMGGNNINIYHMINGQPYTSHYQHLLLNSQKVSAGDQVQRTTMLAQSGNSGNSTGPHLHFELRKGHSEFWSSDNDYTGHLEEVLNLALSSANSVAQTAGAALGGFNSAGLRKMAQELKFSMNPEKWNLQTRVPTPSSSSSTPYSGPIDPYNGDVSTLRHPNGSAFFPDVLRWAGTVEKVLKELSIPTGYIRGILAQIQQESSGDPNAINLTDSNARAGIPSVGLLQMIPGSYSSFAKPGYEDPKYRYDPYLIIYAALRYAMGSNQRNNSGVRMEGYALFDAWNRGDNVAYASGGHVTGPGSETSDSIPARLSNGEYVIRAKSVKKYGTGLLDQINAGRYAAGGKVNEKFVPPKPTDYKGLFGTVAITAADLLNFGLKSIIPDAKKAAAAKAGTAAKADGGKVEVKDGLLYGVKPETIISHAKQALGTPYSTANRAGGPGKGFDCSSFAYWAYEGYPGLMKNGWGSPGGVGWTGTLIDEGKPRDMAAIKAGDILLHNPQSTGGHAALYIGNGQIQHSADPNQIAPLDVWGGFEYARQILAYAKGGLVIPALRKGATINYDNTLANLHRGETVLTSTLSKKLNDGIDNIASGSDVSYNVSVNINKANATAAEIEQAVYSALDKKETRAGRSRVVGARR